MGQPAVGNTSFALDLYDAPAGAMYAFAFAATSANAALGGCTVYVGAPIVTLPGLANGYGFATTPLPIPTLSALAGL